MLSAKVGTLSLSPSLLALITLILITSRASELYHSTNNLVEIFRHKATICPHAHPQWLSLYHTSLSYFLPHPPQGRLLIITVSRDPKFRASPTHPRGGNPHRTTLIAVFGEHPRERVTTELALEILTRYCRSSPSHTDFVLIPIANLQARRRVDVGANCERLNYRSVDLNRNYVLSWGHTDHDTVLEEEQPGVRPLSEFETAAIDALVQRLRPAAYVSVHSGDTAVLVPWDFGESVGGWVTSVANVVRRTHCPLCRVGSARSLFGYRAYGTGTDHMFGVRHVPFACTLEIYGSPSDDCSLMFNPDNRGVLSQVLRNWSGVLETIAKEVGGLAAARSSWYDLLIPTGYLVSIVEDGEREAPIQPMTTQAVAMHTVLFVAIVSIAVIAVRRGLICAPRSGGRRVALKHAVGLTPRRAVVGRSKLVV